MFAVISNPERELRGFEEQENHQRMNEKRWVLLIASEVGQTESVSDRAMERLVEAIGADKAWLP